MPVFDLIWLDKQDSNCTSDWKYYRMTGVGDNIEICQVTFPALADFGKAIQTPCIVGLAVAPEKSAELLKNQFTIDRNRSILIGVRERK